MTGHRRRNRWILAGGLVLVAVVAVGVGLFLSRDQPGEQTLDDAVEEFRGDAPSTDVAPTEGRPEAGVYEAEGDGEAALTSLGLSQQDGPDIPITIVHEDGRCWSVEMSLNEEHRQINHLCRRDDGTVVEPRAETEQQWDLGAFVQDSYTEFTCEPAAVVVDPTAEPGDTWAQSCTGTSSAIGGSTTSAGPYEYVGEEALEVGGAQVATWHYRQERTIAGAQTGDQVVEHWYAVDSGMLVREERRSELGSDSPLGRIAYVEEGWWQLTSLEPSR